MFDYISSIVPVDRWNRLWIRSDHMAYEYLTDAKTESINDYKKCLPNIPDLIQAYPHGNDSLIILTVDGIIGLWSTQLGGRGIVYSMFLPVIITITEDMMALDIYGYVHSLDNRLFYNGIVNWAITHEEIDQLQYQDELTTCIGRNHIVNNNNVIIRGYHSCIYSSGILINNRNEPPNVIQLIYNNVQLIGGDLSTIIGVTSYYRSDDEDYTLILDNDGRLVVANNIDGSLCLIKAIVYNGKDATTMMILRRFVNISKMMRVEDEQGLLYSYSIDRIGDGSLIINLRLHNRLPCKLINSRRMVQQLLYDLNNE